MLSRKSVELAKRIVSAPQGRLLTIPRIGVFTEPYRQSTMQIGMKSIPSLEEAAVGITDTANAMVDGQNEHETEINNSVGIIAQGMRRAFGIVRSTVIPFIDDTTAQVIDRVEEARPKGFTIVQRDLPDIVYDDVFLETIRKYNIIQSFSQRVITKVSFDETPGALIDKMKTGVNQIDEGLADIIARVGESCVVDIFNMLFCGKSPAQLNNENTRIVQGMFTGGKGDMNVNLTTLQSIDIAILTFFLVETFLASPLEGTGLSLTQYQDILYRIRNSVGSSIHNLLKIQATYVRTGTLIIGFPKSKGIHYQDEQGIVTVIGEVYRSAIEKGLTPEAVIGAAINPQQRMQLLNPIIEKASALETLYDRTVKQGIEEATRNRARYFKNAISSVIQKNIDALPEETWPMNFNKVEAATKCNDPAIIDAFFANQYNDEAGNLNDLVEHLVCKYIFNFVDSQKILDLINDELNNLTEDDNEPFTDEGQIKNIRLASYYAFVRYYAEWAVACCDIVRN